jgi:hypothetical protein
MIRALSSTRASQSEQTMAKTPTPGAPQQGSTQSPSQQQGQQGSSQPQQGGQTVFRDWAAI